MADDPIMEWLRSCKCQKYDCMHKQAGDEIERLRTALALAAGEMSTSGEYSYLSPDVLIQKFLNEARND